MFPEKTVDEFWKTQKTTKKHSILLCRKSSETTLKDFAMDRNAGMTSWSNWHIKHERPCLTTFPNSCYRAFYKNLLLLNDWADSKKSLCSRRDNIKLFSIQEENDKDTEEVFRDCLELVLDYHDARSVEIQRVHSSQPRGPRSILRRGMAPRENRLSYQMFHHFL